MIVLLPVSRFRVPYEIARGKPYSKLEHMVLRAVANGGATLRTLRADFRIHERLLVESVVTLVTAGWVAVSGGAEATFVLTAAGQTAASSGKDPVSLVLEEARPAILVMERYSGQVARHADARSWRRNELADVWDTSIKIRPRIVRNSVDEAQAQKLLPRASGERIRRVGRIEEISRNAHYLPLDVDPSSGQIRGLPVAWHGSIAAHAVHLAQRTEEHGTEIVSQTGKATTRRRRFLGVPDAPARARDRSTRVHVAQTDMVVGKTAHEAMLAGALAAAHSSVAIAAPHAHNMDAFVALAARAAEAVARGVRVDLLVGETGPQVNVQQLVAAANRVGHSANPRAGRVLLRTRMPVTGSGASLLLWDSSLGELVAMLTDHHWLGGPDAPEAPVGLRLAEPSLCADLARAVASLWTGRAGHDPALAGASERWRRLAADTEERGALRDALPNQLGLPSATALELLIDDECEPSVGDIEGVGHVGSSVPDSAAGCCPSLKMRMMASLSMTMYGDCFVGFVRRGDGVVCTVTLVGLHGDAGVRAWQCPGPELDDHPERAGARSQPPVMTVINVQAGARGNSRRR
jgi:hypothetical protein